MGAATKSFLCLAVFLISSNAQPVKEQLTIEEVTPLILFRESKPLQLQPECRIASSSSKVEFTWQKDGKPLKYQPTAEGLVIPKPSAEDEGQYQCFAKTSLGTATSGIISLRRTYLNIPSKVIKAKYTPEEGKPFKLDCPIPEAHPKPAILWTYEVTTPRITTGPDGALYFSNVTKEDANNTKYVCDTVSPAYDHRINLYEYELEGIKENKEKSGGLVPQFLSQEMTVEAGLPAMLYCIYGGTPLAYPDWFFEGKNVNGKPGDRVTRHNRTGGKRLLIKNALLSDQGTYTCEANNEIDRPQRHTIKLNVVAAPMYLKKPESVISAPAGQDIIVNCEVEGRPAPQISWTYNAQPLKESDIISISNGPSEETRTAAKLTIKKAQKSNIGYYGCRTENEHGVSYAESLIVIS
ncbi:hemolin-like [Hyposmocoma kahamanoa]|uniref:hemolin-like n=1 Tax=Hyposmocoma kahamanoa TaxID=1477025 RepID=UPI000E6D8A65|nr:hemolin-like [Hyposmocoma kahamanoa]